MQKTIRIDMVLVDPSVVAFGKRGIERTSVKFNSLASKKFLELSLI